ncbi:efflux RND transporter periplasmic adaptor subunit [Haloferula sargassicola]|uniref:RND efflux pump membrane fusion protein barrel-sandwich domain-containing protein n=1 Tax=Haloferula sargassicola TaxID=490096 RepID=A0ABP9UTA4_9BACT
MKTFVKIVAIAGLTIGALSAQDRLKNTVLLDEVGVKNLRLETVMVEERNFDSTVFAVGRVEEVPGNQHSVSSRIPGRAVEVNAFIGERVKKGQTLVKVESRQPGNPPPTIELKAVHDGLVIESHVLQGQPVEPDTELFDISDRTEMWVVAQIPEQLAAGIGPGTKARITFPALGGEPIMAELLRFGVNANREAGAVEGVFQVSNTDGKLQPGMRAEFSIIVSSRPNVLSIPEESLQGDPAARVVYVKDYDLPNAFVRAPVVVGKKGGGWVEIKEGLFPGDEVVTRGSYSLGFVGGGAGPSLKEALDAAHGHAHAEDGSELTEGAKDANAGHENEHDHEEGGAPKWLVYYSVGISILVLLLAQMLWNSKRSSKATPTT